MSYRFVDNFRAGLGWNVSSWQNKFVELVHIVGFIKNKFVTMHGNMNVKKVLVFLDGNGPWSVILREEHTICLRIIH